MGLASLRQHFRQGALAVLSFAVCASVSLGSPLRHSCATSWRGQVVAQSGGRVLRSEVDLQTVDVQVKDKHGNDVRGLTADDFIVRENGERQNIAFFDAGAAPVTVAVLVDSSASMNANGKLGSAEQIAARFLRIARPGDDIYAMDFTERTGSFEHLTAEQLRKPGPVTVPSAGGSGSALYDAIAAAICHLRESMNPRQAIIAISDGIDEHSRLSLAQLVDLVRSQRAQLFMIGLRSRAEFQFGGHIQPTITLVTGHDIDNPDFVFEHLAKEAGAETFIPNSQSGLRDALKAVSAMLNSEYTLAYYPARSSRKVRKIEVKVRRHGVRVLASRTIVANELSTQSVHYVPGTCTVSPKFYPYPYESHIRQSAESETYRDDFSDPHSGWPTHPDSRYVSRGYELVSLQHASHDAREARSLPGALSSIPKPSTYRENVMAAYGPPWPDFRASARMKATFERSVGPEVRPQMWPSVHPAAGLVFRINWKGYYALLVSPSVEYKKKLAFELVARTFQRDTYGQSVIVPWTTVDHASPTDAQLGVQDVGDRVSIFIDGRPVATVRDDTFANGYCGFIVSAAASATFSNLVIEREHNRPTETPGARR
jgi:Ca-activated chloride channel homolog